MPTIHIPSQLRSYTGAQSVVEVKGNTVAEALQDLVSQFPEIEDRLFDEEGKLRRFVNIFLGDEDIRFIDYLDTAVEENDELSIIPAIAGGCHEPNCVW